MKQRDSRVAHLVICWLACFAAALAALPAAAQQRPASAGPADPKLMEDLIAANRILAQQGVVDGMGHVSVRHNRDPNRYLISLARAPELVTAEDIMEYDLDSNPVRDPGRRQYSERYIHGEIYKLRPDVMAVVHNHSPAVIPFTVSSVPLRAITHSGGFLADGLPLYEIREGNGMTDMLVSNAAYGHALAQKLGDKAAILMRGHGAAVVGQVAALRRRPQHLPRARREAAGAGDRARRHRQLPRPGGRPQDRGAARLHPLVGAVEAPGNGQVVP